VSGAADKLAHTRLAIIAHAQARERHHERREPDDDDAYGDMDAGAAQPRTRAQRLWNRVDPRGGRAAGWLGQARHLLRTWWRHHPASMGVDFARPVLSSYAARKPVQYLGIAAAVGAVCMLVRPWRMISATGLVVALLKSSQLSGLVMSAMAGADFGHEDDPPA
jgi:hypothetical protein